MNRESAHRFKSNPYPISFRNSTKIPSSSDLSSLNSLLPQNNFSLSSETSPKTLVTGLFYNTMATINVQSEAAQDNIAPPKQPLPPPKTVDSQSVLRRLQSELMALMMSGDPGISAFPEEDNIFCWKGTITGSKDTVFEGTEYKLSLSFPNDYPFKAPKVKFETTCFHPNVDVHGNICLDILQDKWSSAYDVRTILLSIQSLLGEPNISSPLNPQAAQLWSNQEEYRKMVEKLYKFPSA